MDSTKLTPKEIRNIRKQQLAEIREKEKLDAPIYKEITSTQAILPVRDIMDGIVITRDDRYVKILEFLPINFAYMNAEMQNRIISDFMGMLHTEQFDIQIKTISKKADVERIINTVREYFNKEKDFQRKKMLLAYMKLMRKTALSVGISRRFFIIIQTHPTMINGGMDFATIRADLNSAAGQIRADMEQCGNIFCGDLDQDWSLYELFYQLLNRTRSETVPFSTHATEILQKYSDAVDGGELPPINANEFFAPDWIDFEHPKHIATDDTFYTYAYIPSNGYNTEVYAGWTSMFVNAFEGVDMDIFFRKVPREEVVGKIGMSVKLERANAGESHDTDADYYSRLDTISSAEYMMRGLSDGNDFYYISTLITVSASSIEEMEWKYNELEKRAKASGLSLRRAVFKMEQCFNSTLPICLLDKDIEKKSRRNALTPGAASLYPFISYEMQDPDGIMVGCNKANSSLVTIDMFDTRIHPNANAVILGSSGYGKTFTAQLFALRLSLMDVQTFVIAPLKGVEDYMGGCTAVNGQFVSMDPSSSNAINIMDIRLPDDTDLIEMEGGITVSYLTRKVHTIKTFMNLVVKDLTQEEEQLIDACLYSLYGRFGITNDNSSIVDSITHAYKRMPLLGDLYLEMESEPVLKRVRNILKPLIVGSLSCYNQPTNVNLDSKYVVFDFNGLKGDILVMSMFIALDFVWSKIKEDRKKRKAVLIDECWKLIGTDSNQRAAEDVVEIFRTIRAYGGSAFAMTQDVSQFFEYENGKYGKAVIGNADTKIIMHLNPNEAYKLQEAVQLTDSEIQSVIKLQRGNGLVATSNSKLFVEFLASEYERKAISTDAASFYRMAKEAQTSELMSKFMGNSVSELDAELAYEIERLEEEREAREGAQPAEEEEDTPTDSTPTVMEWSLGDDASADRFDDFDRKAAAANNPVLDLQNGFLPDSDEDILDADAFAGTDFVIGDDAFN